MAACIARVEDSWKQPGGLSFALPQVVDGTPAKSRVRLDLAPTNAGKLCIITSVLRCVCECDHGKCKLSTGGVLIGSQREGQAECTRAICKDLRVFSVSTTLDDMCTVAL